MKALTWHATKDVRVIDVPDPEIIEPTDAIIRVTSAAICGSDLHLYDVFGPFLHRGDILGHETMGSCRGALRDRLRALLHVRARPDDAMRDDSRS
jgi:threonine dehydrogenase-like Zn-dependent dehydrogenase